MGALLAKECSLVWAQSPPTETGFKTLDKKEINVDVDVNGFFPISADTIYERVFGETLPESENGVG